MKTNTVYPPAGEKFHPIRANHVTASSVAALFGENEYLSEWQLWHYIVQGPRAREAGLAALLGTHLEAGVAAALETHEGMTLEKEPGYIYSEELRFGASLDFWCYRWGDREFPDGVPLDIKCVSGPSWATRWKSGAEVPSVYYLQMIGQMALTGTKTSFLGIMVAGSDLKVIEVEWNEAVWEAMRERLVAFWESVDQKRPPMADVKKDQDELLRRFRHTTKGVTLDLTGDNHLHETAMRYRAVSEQHAAASKIVRDLDKERTTLKAFIVEKIGSAETALVGNLRIESKTTARKGFTVAASESRSINVEEN